MRSFFLFLALFCAAVGAQNCETNSDPDEGDPIDVNPQPGVQCDTLIGETKYEVNEGDDLTLACDTGIGGVMGLVETCKWVLPAGTECEFTFRENGGFEPDNLYCSGAPGIRFAGDFTQSNCDAILTDADEGVHDGLWKCTALVGATTYVDTVDIEVLTGVSTATVMAITIPIGVILLLALILLLILLVVRRRRKNKQPKAAQPNIVVLPEERRDVISHAEGGTPMYQPYESVEDSHTYESSTSSSSRPLNGGTYEQVVYTHPRPSMPNPPGVGFEQRTAKKISNAASMNSFADRGKRMNY